MAGKALKIAIVGAGAMGSLFAGLLARASEKLDSRDEIWLVGSPSRLPHLGKTREEGLRLNFFPELIRHIPQIIDFPNEVTGQPFLSSFPRVTTDPAEVYPCDLALVLVKSYRTPEAAQQVAQLLSPGGIAITLQNGLGNREALAEKLGENRVLQGVTSLAARVLEKEPGKVLFTGLGLTGFGIPPEPGAEGLVRALAERLQVLGLPVETTPNVAGLVWGKVIINCAINPLTALLNVPNGALLESADSLVLLEEAAEEAAGVARAGGIELPYPYEQASARACEVARKTAPNISSMLTDVRRKRPTEIKAINGAVAEAGQRFGFPAPVNGTLYRLVMALEKTYTIPV